MDLLKAAFLSYIAGILTVLSLTLLLLYSEPEVMPSFWGIDPLEVHNKMVGRVDYRTARMDEEMKMAQNNPKFLYMSGEKARGVINGTGTVRIAEKGHFFMKGKYGGVDDFTFPTIDMSFKEITFQTASYLWREDAPVFLIFDNSEKVELFFEMIEVEGKLVRSEMISGDYAERIQRKILDSKVIKFEYTDNNNKKSFTEFDVDGLQWYGLEKP